MGIIDGTFFNPQISATEIRDTTEGELLGLTINQRLKLDTDIHKLCKQYSQGKTVF